MSRMKWGLGAAAVAAVAIAAWTFTHLTGGVPVAVATVEVGPIHQCVDEQGKTRLPRTYLITMPETGRIEEIDLREGMAVEKGQVVARIVPKDLQLDVDLSKAAVESLAARIRENADTTVEDTGLLQAEQFAASMRATEKAAAERVRAGKAKITFAEKNLQRVRELSATNTMTPDDLDRAELLHAESDVEFQQDKLVESAMTAIRMATDLLPTMVRQVIDRKKLAEDVLRGQMAEAAIQLDQSEVDQTRGTMISPIDGVVLERFVTNERFLQAGAMLLELGRLEDLQIEADILSVDVVDAAVGDPVEVHGPAVGETPVRGSVERIHPAGFTKVSSLGVEQQRVKVIIRIDDEDKQRLLSDRRVGVDYRVRARIITDSKDDALLVPRSALFRGDDSRWRVYKINGGRAVMQAVEVGLMNDDHVEIVAGLDQGDRVVVAPENTLYDGARVRPIE